MGKDEALAGLRAIKDTESRCSVRQHVNSHSDAVQWAQEPPQVHVDRTVFYELELCVIKHGRQWRTIRHLVASSGSVERDQMDIGSFCDIFLSYMNKLWVFFLMPNLDSRQFGELLISHVIPREAIFCGTANRKKPRHFLYSSDKS